MSTAEDPPRFVAMRSSPVLVARLSFIRLFGTLGFIVPAFVIELWWLRGLEGVALAEARGIAFALSGWVGLVMCGYCLTLPATPPQPNAERKYAPGVVMSLLRQRGFLVLVTVTFFICIAHQYFFVFNSPFLREILDSGGWEGAMEQRISSIGQWCEMAVMLVLGFMLKRWGYKRILIVGAGAYMLRFLLFALVFSVDPPFAGKLALAGMGQALHGFCFGCFLAVGYLYVDRIAPADAGRDGFELELRTLSPDLLALQDLGALPTVDFGVAVRMGHTPGTPVVAGREVDDLIHAHVDGEIAVVDAVVLHSPFLGRPDDG